MLFELLGKFRRYVTHAFLIGVIFAGASTLLATPVSAAAGINQQLNFQGRLLNAQGAAAPDGYYNVEFKIYQDGTGAAGNPGGTLKWTEDWLNSASNSVRVVNGYISVQLGSVNPFGSSIDWNQDTIWLSVNIGNTSSCTITTNFTANCGGDGEMVPMKRLSAVPYALNAAKLGGLTSAGFIQNTTTVQTSTNMAIDGIARADTSVLTPLLDTATNVALNIGTTNASVINLNQNVTVAADKTLTLTGGTTATRNGLTGTEGMIFYDTDTKQLMVYSNGKWQADRSEAILVAASNSSDADKASADYVANGNTGAANDGDQVQINQALTAGTGKKVVLLAGTYTVDASISIPSNTLLSGVGYGSVITVPNGFNSDINAITSSSTGGIAVQNLRLEGNKGTQSSGNMNGISFSSVGSGSGQSALAGAKVSNVWANNWMLSGIEFDSSVNGSITGSYFSTNQIGVRLNNSSSHTVVSNNTVQGSLSIGILAQNGSANNTFTGNDLSGNAIGIDIQTDNNVVTGNSVDGSGSMGILFYNSSYNTISSNTIKDSAAYGIYLQSSSNNNTITSNTVQNSGNTTNNNGIFSQGFNNTISSNSITDTSCTTTCYAINIFGSSTYLAGNTFTGDGTYAASINNAGSGTILGGQVDVSGNFLIQPAGTIELLRDTNVTGTLSASTAVLTPSLDRSSAGTLSIGTNATNTTAITIGSSSMTTSVAGKLAIGTVTSSPIANLQIQGTLGVIGPVSYPVYFDTSPSSAYWTIDKSNTASDASIVLRDQGAVKAEIGLVADNNIHFKTASGAAGSETYTDRMIIQSTGEIYTAGKLGVGTVPTEQLHVAASSGAGKVIAKIENTNTGAGSRASGLQLKSSTNDWTVGTDVGLNGGNNFAIQDNNFGYMPRFFIDSTGRVGIGTDNPAYKLDVAGDLHTTSNIQIGSTTTDATAAFLGLDSYNQATDPAGINGAMYYNTNTNKFRCYENGAWANCTSSAANVIQNQNTAQQPASNFWISGTARADTSVITPTLDTATAVNLNIGSTSSAINLNQNVVVAATKTLSIAGDTRANITAIASPTEGMMTYDTTNKQLLVYANGKWQADRTNATLVAASDSTQAAKDAADFVGDGNTAAAGDGDQVQITSALADANPAGTGRKTGKVYLFPGTYTIDAQISIPNNTILAGAGTGTVITIPNSFNTNIYAITNTTTGGNGTGIVIQDLKLDGNKANQGSGTMDGIHFDGAGSGADASAIVGAKISNTVAINWNARGILLSSSSNNTVTGNTAQGNTYYGILLTVSSNNNTVTGNTVQGNSSRGIYLASSSNNTITGNTAQGNTNDGIYLSSSSNNTITGNTAQGNGIGIELNASPNNTVTGNTAQGNTSNGIYLFSTSSNAVTGNTVQGNTVNGIYLAASTNDIVTGNTVQGNASKGIFLYSSSNANTVTGNNLYDNGGATTNNAIYLDASDSNTITSNTVTDTSYTTNNYAINIFNSTSDTNYIGANTLGTGSVNDAGTGTVYGGQVDASGNFLIKPAGTVELQKNTNVTGTLAASTSVLSPIVDRASPGTLQIGTNATNSTTISIGSAGMTTTVQGNLTAGTSAGTGTFTNNGATINAEKAYTNFAANNPLDTAANSVDKYTYFSVLQTTTGITLTLPTPTTSPTTVFGRVIHVSNIGSTSFTIGSSMIMPGYTATFIWSNTDGAAAGGETWQYAGDGGGSGSYIQNGTTQQTANFNISGSGTANTLQAAASVASPLVDAISGSLSLGTGANSTSVIIGKTAASTLIASNTLTVGTATNNPANTNSILGAAQTNTNIAGNAMLIRGSTGAGNGNGGVVTLQGGNAGATSGANGGNLVLAGGTGSGTGVGGLVVINSAAYSTSSVQASATSVNITQANIDSFGAVILNATAASVNFTLTSPTLGASAAGRLIYVTAANGSSDFTLRANVGGGTGVEQNIAMRMNTTATMIWNGSQWTAAGASSSTTLQSAYDNTLQSAGGAELIVSKTSATNGLTIRDTTGVNAVNGALLTVQTGSAANLFSVNSNVTEYTSNSGAELYAVGNTAAFPASTWVLLNGSTVTRNIATANIATGQGSAQVVTSTTASSGVKNVLSASLTAGQHYNVSFTAKLSTGTFTDLAVYYSVDGTTTVGSMTQCTTANQAIKTSVWTKVNCAFTAPSTGITAANSINIIQVGSGTAHTFFVDNVSVTIAADYNYATDGTVNDNTNFGTNWTTTGTGSTVTRNTGDGQEASDSAQAVITTGGTNRGVRNKLAISPLTDTLYRVSVYAKQTSGAAFSDFSVRYSRDGGTSFVSCVDYNTQTVAGAWVQITCYIKTDTTAPSGSGPYVYFTAATSSARTFLVDAFSMTLASNSTPNVQIGGGADGGPTTLFTLDKGASAPIAANNDDLLGSMYYDTTLGKLQCYEADGWGACGSSPDNIITISPEYTNAVLHGTGIGTMTSDICSDYLNINDGSSGQPTICGTNETYNFYKWTSPQATSQYYSVYVTYQLPATFKSFNSGQTSLMGRTDSANSSVTYQVYRNDGSGLASCGGAITVSSGIQSSWQTVTATGASDPSTCSFSPGSSIVFKITVMASQNANAYVGNLNFSFSNK